MTKKRFPRLAGVESGAVLRVSWAPLLLWFWCSGAVALEGTLLVANRTGGSISFIDLTTSVEIARVPIGPVIPHEIAVSPDGRLALTSEYGPESAPDGMAWTPIRVSIMMEE